MALITLDYLYCTEGDVQRYLSAAGVALRIDDGAGAIDAAFQDAIIEASETINFYLWQKYFNYSLATSNWVNRKCTALAAYVVCGRRGNEPPENVIERAEKAQEELKQVADNRRLVPGLPLKLYLAPQMSNIRFDPRYEFSCLRVERKQSTRNASKLPQNVDYRDQWTVDDWCI